MEIYYKRIKTYQSYPNNDLLDTDEVHFSRSKNKFDANVFLKLDPLIGIKDREKAVKAALKIKSFYLVKI